MVDIFENCENKKCIVVCLDILGCKSYYLDQGYEDKASFISKIQKQFCNNHDLKGWVDVVAENKSIRYNIKPRSACYGDTFLYAYPYEVEHLEQIILSLLYNIANLILLFLKEGLILKGAMVKDDFTVYNQLVPASRAIASAHALEDDVKVPMICIEDNLVEEMKKHIKSLNLSDIIIQIDGKEYFDFLGYLKWLYGYLKPEEQANLLSMLEQCSSAIRKNITKTAENKKANKYWVYLGKYFENHNLQSVHSL